MTTIAAIKNADGFSIAWDHQISAGSGIVGTTDKVRSYHNGQMIVGTAGSLRILNLVEAMEMPLPPIDDTDLWMTRTFIPALAATLKEGEILGVENGIAKGDLRLIVYVNGEAYIVGSTLCWYKPMDGIFAIGSGDDFAKGAMCAGASPEKAVKIASRNDIYTGDVVSTLEVPIGWA